MNTSLTLLRDLSWCLRRRGNSGLVLWASQSVKDYGKSRKCYDVNQSVKHFKNFIVRFVLVLSYTISIVLNTPLD